MPVIAPEDHPVGQDMEVESSGVYDLPLSVVVSCF